MRFWREKLPHQQIQIFLFWKELIQNLILAYFFGIFINLGGSQCNVLMEYRLQNMDFGENAPRTLASDMEFLFYCLY